MSMSEDSKNNSEFGGQSPKHFQSSEKTREVITRPDGSKMVRVEKRRRVIGKDNHREKEKDVSQMKKTGIVLAILLVVILGSIIGLVMYKISSFNSPEYVKELEAELAGRFCAQKVECKSVHVDTTSATMKELVMSGFPEDSPFAFVRLENVSAELKPSSFFVGYLKGTRFSAKTLTIGLKENAQKFKVPTADNSLKTTFDYYYVSDFYLGTADSDGESIDYNKGSFYLNTELYVRKSYNEKEDAYILSLSNKKLSIKGWPSMKIDTGSIMLSDKGLSNLSILCYLDNSRTDTAVSKSIISLGGAIPFGSDLSQRLFTFKGTNVAINQYIGLGLEPIFRSMAGRTPMETKPEMTECNFNFSMPVGDQDRPSLKGWSGMVIESQWTRLPVLSLLAEMTSRKSDVGNSYASPKFTEGTFAMETDGTNDVIKISDIYLKDINILTLKGDMSLIKGQLSGNLTFYLPAYRVDPKDCPKAAQRDGTDLRLDVKLSGTPENPIDTSIPMLEAVKKQQLESIRKAPVLPAMPKAEPVENSNPSTEDKPSNLSFDSLIQ